MSSKIHPDVENSKQYDHVESKEYSGDGGGSSRVLTVWKRSSMTFQGTDGFTVFDQHGRLVFRVDNYSRRNGFVAGGGLVLMDGAGNALLTLKTQLLRVQTQWDAYRGDQDECGRSTNKSIVFSMRSSSSGIFRSRKDMIDVFMGGVRRQNQTPEYRIEGSFRARDCKIRKASGQVVAKMARKRVNNTILLNSDVFSLFVHPGFDAELVMAFVIILDRMSSKPFTPLLCS